MMKRLVEEYLIELMKQFNEFGILGPDGKPFEPDNFAPGDNFNYGALTLFELGEDQPVNLADRNESHQNFYALQCDNLESALNEDPLLKAALEDEKLGWINVNTKKENQYPIKALKAMWNHILHPNKVLNGNEWFHTKASTLLGLQPFLRYHAGYLDDSRTTNPDVRYYGVPRIIDERTLAFSKKCLILFDKIISLDEPLNALYEMIGVVANAIPQAMFDKIVATYKETHRELQERIPRFEESREKVPTQAELESLLTKINELKKPAQDGIDKYHPYFNFTSVIQKQIREFEARNTDTSNEEKAAFYTSLLNQFREFEGKKAPTAVEIEEDIQSLSLQQSDLSENIMTLLGKEKNVHYLSKELLKAIYVALRTPDLLETYKAGIRKTHSDLHDIKHQIETKLQEVTLLGKAKKLVADKREADIQLAKLRENKTRLESTLQELNETGIEYRKKELEENISDYKKVEGAAISLHEKLREKLGILETAENWDIKIDEELLDELGRLLQWRTDTLQYWKQKNNDYQWSKTDESPPISHSTGEDSVNNDSANSSFFSFSGLLNTSATLASSLAFQVSATFADMTPKQELITELKQNLDALEDQQAKNTERFHELNDTLEKLKSGDEESAEKAMREIETRKQSIERKRLDLDNELGNLVTNGNELSDQYKQLLSERTENLKAVITRSTEELTQLEIQSGKIEDLKAIFDTTANDIKKIKEEFDAIVAEGREVFGSVEINTAKEDFNRQYQLYEQNQLVLIKSMTEMADQLLNDYSGADKTEGADTRMEQHINVLATQLKELALTYLPQEKTLAEKIQAKENFEQACGQELYSNNIKIAVGVVVGILSTIVLCAAITAALAVFFAGGGWLAFMIGAPILAKAGVTAAASSLTVGGCIVGGAVGEHLDEKHSQGYFEQWRFFYEKVDQDASKTCENTKNSATTTQRPKIDVELDLSSISLETM